MAICVSSAAMILQVAAAGFTLSWQHSVEKIPWQESWTARQDGLHLTQARVKGSGAGMEPPEDAVLRDGWYVFLPDIPPLPELVLAASGDTVSGWIFCAAGECHELGATASDPIRIRWCDDSD